MGILRLDKFLADSGIGTRKEVKKYISAGKVLVNQEVVKKPEWKINTEKDQVCADGQVLTYEELVYYMLYKPAGVVSATEDKRERTVLDLLEVPQKKQLFPVGRLDKDTEGLLLLTNDGALAHTLLSPKKHVDKTYFVKLQKPLSRKEKEALEAGVSIGEAQKTLPAKIESWSQESCELYLTIQEGKFHQIKRMMEAVGNHVEFLKRISMGSLVLDAALKLGTYRALTQEEITRLKEDGKKHKSSDF